MKYICKKPSKKTREILERDSKVISGCLTREYDFIYKKARGNYIYDVDNKKYLDFSASVAVMNIGHSNRKVLRAILRQSRKGLHCGFSDFYSMLPVKFSEKLVSMLPKNLNQVYLSNSGTEAVEAAYKLARWHTKKKWFIAFENAFHGRTMGSLSLTKSIEVQRKKYGPFLPVKHVPYAYCYRCKFNKKYPSCSLECLHNLEREVKKLKGNLAGIFIEPVQGEGGYIVPPKEFIKGIREICNHYGILLCDDEVQSGCFRTGEFLAMNNFGVKPDVVSLSKAIGGGLPIGATVSNRKIMDWVSGSHASTFGGNLVACSAGLASLRFMEKKKLGVRSKKLGDYMIKRLEEIGDSNKLIGDVRGLGLMIGVELVRNGKKPAFKERKKILCECVRNRLILLPAGNKSSVIRFCPPLTIGKGHINKCLRIFEDSLKKV